MEIKEIHVSIKFTKNLGNFQSFTAEAGVVAVVEQGDNIKDVYDSLWNEAKHQVSSQIKGLRSDGGMM